MSKLKFKFQALINQPPLIMKFMAVGLMLLSVIGVTGVALATGQNDSNPSDRLVTIYDGGREKTIVTRADTVNEALLAAGITVDSVDIVEPAVDTELVAKSYSVNIYRARPIVVIDGTRAIRVVTAAQSSSAIATAAGVSIHPEDKTVIDRSDDLIATGGVGLTMTIDRATEIRLRLYGQDITVRTHAATVGEFLRERNIRLGADDSLNVDSATKITDGIEIEIWRNGKQTITVEEPVAFETEQIKDADREVGFREVKTAGKDGVKSVTYEVEMKNGIEVARTEIQSVVTKEPTKQVETIGTKPRAPAVPSNPGANAELGHQMMLEYGFGEDQWSCLYNLWNRESGWRTNAHNPSGAHGIPQALPGSKMGAGWESDPVVQIRWGLGYIKSRYGTPCGAWSAFQQKGWY